MAAEDLRRDGQGVVTDGDGDEQPYRPAPAVERMARLEVKMDESRSDRRKLHERLDEVEKNISDQIKVQTERTAYMDILKWGAALILTAIGGYVSAVLTSHAEKTTATLEQHSGHQ